MQWVEGLVIYTGAVLAWTLGLFVLSRGGLRRIPLLTAATTLVLVVYQVGQALGALAPDAGVWLDWSRRTWWAAALAPGLWLALALALALEEAATTAQPRLTRLVWSAAPVVALAGVLFALIGESTDLVSDWSSPSAPRGLLHVPPGPLFGAYLAYVVACLAGASLVLGRLWWTASPGNPLRSRFGWLVVSASAFLLTGVYLTTVSGLLGYGALPAQVLLSVGLIIMLWSLARYGALLAGETVLADLLAFGLATATLLGLYGVLLVLLIPFDYAWLERLLPLLLLLLATHVAADRQN